MANDLIDRLKAATEGTKPGPWYSVMPDYAHGWWVISSDVDGIDTIDESGDGGFEESTSRFIADARQLVPEAAAKIEELVSLGNALALRLKMVVGQEDIILRWEKAVLSK